MYVVTIKPCNYTLFVNKGETVLDAALRQGFDFPYSCRSATCASCMGKVLSGQYNYGHIEPYALDEAEQSEGFALFCSVYPETDLIIQMNDVVGPEYIPVKTLEYQIQQHQVLAENIHQIMLAPLTEKALRYHPGQYVKILSDDAAVPFSIANMPNAEQSIELHIHDAKNNVYTKQLLEKIRNKENLTLKGPFGRVILHAEPRLPIIFAASGTGFAPCKAMLEQLHSKQDSRPIHLFWGNDGDAYLKNLGEQWATQYPNFQFTAIDYSQQQDLANAITATYSDLSQYQVYTSASPQTVYALRDKFLTHGLKPYLLYSDVFECYPE